MVICVFSTSSAILNRLVHDGIRAAFREINLAGGVRGQNLSFISLDDGYNPTRSLQNTLALLQNYSLVGILSPSGSCVAISARVELIASHPDRLPDLARSNSMSTWLPVAKNYSMPVYFMNSGNSIFRTPFDRSIVHLQVGNNDEVMAHIHYALKVLLHRRIAIVYQDDLFGGGCFGNAVAALNHVGLAPWAVGKYPSNAQNVTAVIEALLPVGTKPPQSVVMCGLARQASLTISGFRARSPAPTAFFLISGATIQEMQAYLGPTGNFANIYFTSSAPNPHDTSNPLILRVRQALAAYNASLTMPLHGHVLGYTAGRLLHQALQRIDMSVPITPTALNDIFMATSMFNVDGLQIGPYLDHGTTACSQGLRTVWMAQLTATSWIGLPRGTFSWTGCLADPSSLSLPILWGTLLSQQDMVEHAFQQGVRAAFQSGVRGTDVQLVTIDAATDSAWVGGDQLTGLVGVTRALVSEPALALSKLVDALGGRPVVGVLSGDAAFYSNDSHRALLPQRAPYMTELYAVLQTVLDMGLARVGVLCYADMAATRACDDAVMALDDMKMRPAFVASVRASDLAWSTMSQLLASVPQFDDEAFNLPAQAIVFVGRDADVLRYLLEVSARHGFAHVVWAVASYMDASIADPRLIRSNVIPPRLAHYRGFYIALDAAGVVTNSTNAAVNTAAVQGFLTGSMIILTSNNLASPYSGPDFIRSIYFTTRITAHEVEIGPFTDPSECEESRMCQTCRHGQSTVFVTTFNSSTVSHRFPGCGPTPSAQSRSWPSTCSIRSRYDVELIRGIDRGMRVSAVGTVVSLGVLFVAIAVVLASAHMTLWNRPRQIMVDRSTVILVRPSMSNYIALLSVVMDAVELSSLFLPWQIPWISSLFGGATGLYQSTGAQIASIIAALVWIAFAVTFLRRSLLHWFQRHAPLLLVLGANLLPLIGNIGLLPVVSGLSAPFRISCTTNACYVTGDCSGSAWTLAHWGKIAAAGFSLLVYLPLNIYFSSLWQKLQEDLDVFVRTWLNVGQNVVKVLLCLLAALLPRFIFPVLVFNLVATVLLIAMVARGNPTRIPWYPIMKLCSLAAALGTAVIALVTHVLNVTDPLIPTAALAIQWIATLSAGAIAFRRRFARIFLPTPRRRDKISMLAKLFRAGRRSQSSSAPQHMSESGEHCPSALPKIWKRTVTQWLVDLESRRLLTAADLTWLLLDLDLPAASFVHGIAVTAQGDPDKFTDLLLHQPMLHLVRSRMLARDLVPGRTGTSHRRASRGHEVSATEKGDPAAVVTSTAVLPAGVPTVLVSAAMAMNAGIREESEAPLPALDAGSVPRPEGTAGGVPLRVGNVAMLEGSKLVGNLSALTAAVPSENATRDGGAMSDLGSVTVAPATTVAAESRMGSLLPTASDRKLGPDSSPSTSSSREHRSESVGADQFDASMPPVLAEADASPPSDAHPTDAAAPTDMSLALPVLSPEPGSARLSTESIDASCNAEPTLRTGLRHASRSMPMLFHSNDALSGHTTAAADCAASADVQHAATLPPQTIVRAESAPDSPSSSDQSLDPATATRAAPQNPSVDAQTLQLMRQAATEVVARTTVPRVAGSPLAVPVHDSLTVGGSASSPGAPRVPGTALPLATIRNRSRSMAKSITLTDVPQTPPSLPRSVAESPGRGTPSRPSRSPSVFSSIAAVVIPTQESGKGIGRRSSGGSGPVRSGSTSRARPGSDREIDAPPPAGTEETAPEPHGPRARSISAFAPPRPAAELAKLAMRVRSKSSAVSRSQAALAESKAAAAVGIRAVRPRKLSGSMPLAQNRKSGGPPPPPGKDAAAKSTSAMPMPVSDSPEASSTPASGRSRGVSRASLGVADARERTPAPSIPNVVLTDMDSNPDVSTEPVVTVSAPRRTVAWSDAPPQAAGPKIRITVGGDDVEDDERDDEFGGMHGRDREVTVDDEDEDDWQVQPQRDRYYDPEEDDEVPTAPLRVPLKGSMGALATGGPPLPLARIVSRSRTALTDSGGAGPADLLASARNLFLGASNSGSGGVAAASGDDAANGDYLNYLLTRKFSSANFIMRMESKDVVWDTGAPQAKFVGPFLLGSVIGKGAYGKVKDGLCSETLQPVAIKIVAHKRLRKITNGVESVTREIATLKRLRGHPNVVRLLEVYAKAEDPDGNVDWMPWSEHLEQAGEYKTLKRYLIFEYCHGNVQGLLDSAPGGKLPLHQVQDYTKQLIEGLTYLCARHVIHRDIKPANLLLTVDGLLKVSDFGVAEVLSPYDGFDACQNFAGTHHYMSPEVAAGDLHPSGEKVDVWAAGVTVYNMAFGRFPFDDQGGKADDYGPAAQVMGLYERIQAAKLTFPEETHDELVRLLEGMLEKDPAPRWTLAQIRRAPFLTMVPTDLATDDYVPLPTLTADAAVVHAAATLGRQRGLLSPSRPTTPSSMGTTSSRPGSSLARPSTDDDDSEADRTRVPYSLFPVLEPLFPDLADLTPLPGRNASAVQLDVPMAGSRASSANASSAASSARGSYAEGLASAETVVGVIKDRDVGGGSGVMASVTARIGFRLGFFGR
ncbi:Serine/threonine-protein kinase stk11 [Allomyces javanicus]|nr:Serine/threonine-protein kinase stk11 [Allomyces javanicus]